MAEETQLEKTAKAAPEKKEEQKPKQIGALENVVNESAHGAKTLFNLGLAGLIPAGLASTFPYAARDIGVLTGAQIAADATTNFKRGKKTTGGEIAISSAVGTGLAVPTHYLFKFINKIPLDSTLGYLERAAAFGGIGYPAYIALYQFLDYTIRNRGFKGLGKYMKENYWTALKSAWKKIFPIGVLNVLFMPYYLQIPISAALSYAIALFGAPKKGEVPEHLKRDKTPYLVAASNSFGKLGSAVIYSPFKALYEIGSGLYKAVPKPATPAPAAVPATAPAR